MKLTFQQNIGKNWEKYENIILEQLSIDKHKADF